MTELNKNGKSDNRSGSAHARSRDRARLVLVGVLLLVSVALGAAANRGSEVVRSPVSSPGLALPGSPASSAASLGPVHLSARLDRGAVQRGGDGVLNLELTIRADAGAGSGGDAVRVPIDLVVVLDRSGSMAGAPLEYALASVSELIAALGPEDRFSLVSYSSDSRVDVPLSQASYAAKTAWSRVLSSLRAQGGTNMARGLDLANAEVVRLGEAGRAARVILLSDGHANEGDHSHAGLRARAAAAVSGEYVLSTVGVGSGFDEQLMSTLADAGTGNFYYVRQLAQLSGVFAGEFASARETVAQALEVSIDPGPGVQILDAAGYPLERTRDGLVRFRPGALFAGQERRIWLSFRAETQRLGEQTLGRIWLRYVADGEHRELELKTPLQFACVEGEKAFRASVDRDVWGQNLATEGLNKLKQAMSHSLQKGDVKEARGAYARFRSSALRENAHYDSEVVEQALEEAAVMAQELDDAVAKSPQARNEFSKKLSVEGLDGRRVGAKHR